MSAKEEYYRRKADKKAEQEKNIVENWKSKLKDPITAFTGVLAVLAIFQLIALNSTDTATHDLAKAANDQAISMQSQLDEIKQQSLAIERSSTAGRAYLFVKYPTPQAPTINPINPDPSATHETIYVTIRFSIQNVGTTPAVITKFESHLFLNADPREIIREPPDPVSVEAESMKESFQMPASWQGGLLATDEIIQQRPIIPASGDTGDIQQGFGFKARAKTPGGHHSVMGAWWYCSITYRDIFGKERHTTSYIGLYGAGIKYPKDDKYNTWD